MIAHIPGATRPGQRINGFVQPMDLMPTFLDMANVSPTGTTHGNSVLPLVRGEVAGIRDYAVSSHTIIGPVAGRPSSIRTRDWTLILGARESEDPSNVPDNMRQSQDGTIFTEAIDSLRRREVASDAALLSQLYDNNTDPGHTHNVISGNIEIADRLRDQYVQFLESVGTPDEYIAPRRNLSLG